MLVLVQTSDLGSALLNFGIFLAMLYAATGRLLVRRRRPRAVRRRARRRSTTPSPASQQRVTVWLQPWTDEKVYCSINGQLEYRQNCDSYQLVKSLYSIANGGYGGTGHRQRHVRDGRRHAADPVPANRLRLLGDRPGARAGRRGAVLLLFLALVARGMRIALIAQDGFSKLLAAGLSFGFALQTFIIVGGVLRLVPLTGITLPFVSYGGSSIVSNFVMLALLMLVSQPRRRAERRT